MAEMYGFLYVDAKSVEQIAAAKLAIGEYKHAIESQRIIANRCVITNFLLGSEGEATMREVLNNLVALNGELDVRAYLCGDEEAWECFFRIIDGDVIAKEYYPFEDSDIDLEEYNEGAYQWWHDRISCDVRVGFLQGSIEHDPSRGLCSENELLLDVSKYRETEASYAYVEFGLGGPLSARIKNSIKKAIREVFDSFHISQSKVFENEGRYGLLYLGYIWPEAIADVFGHAHISKVLEILTKAGAYNIILSLFHKEVEFESLALSVSASGLRVFESKDGKVAERRDLEFAGNLLGKLTRYLPRVKRKDRNSVAVEDQLSVVEQYCKSNGIAMSSVLGRKWRGEQYVFVDFNLKKVYAVSTDHIEVVQDFLSKKRIEQSREFLLGVLNVFASQICIFDSACNVDCIDI